MSNTIWKMPEETPASCFLCVFDRPMGRSVGHYNPVKKQFCSGKLRFEYKDIDKFCMIDDLIAQADKAERLQMKVDVLEHINDSWAKYCGQKIKTDSTVAESRQITYMADGRTKVYYGQNGTQIETNLPLPVGFVITIRETTNDK